MTEIAEVAVGAAEALARQVEVLKAFLAEHPEVAEAIGAPRPAGPPVKLTFGHVLTHLVDLIPGIDLERREQMHDVVAAHQAEHEQLVAAAPAAPPAPAPAPAPAPPPVVTTPLPAEAPAAPVATAVDAAELEQFRAWQAAQHAQDAVPGE